MIAVLDSNSPQLITGVMAATVCAPGTSGSSPIALTCNNTSVTCNDTTIKCNATTYIP